MLRDAETAHRQTPAKRPGVALLFALRKTHLYFGLFIAPALLFFGFTGAMQTLSLHEAAGSSYKPPALIARLGTLHKDQTIEVRVRKAPSPPQAVRPEAPRPNPGPQPPPITLAAKQKQHLPMKIFFLTVALGLFSSTFTGIYMAYKYERNRLLVTALLLAGVLIPLLLLRF